MAEETRGLNEANRVRRRGMGSELDETDPGVDVIVKELRKMRAVVSLGYGVPTLQHVLNARKSRIWR